MNKQVYTHGKLLLSGEYAVLDGALALAIPTRYGQRLNVVSESGNHVSWKAFDHNGKAWLEHRFERQELLERAWEKWEDPSAMVARLLQMLFTENPGLWPDGQALHFESNLEFPRNWGLGSSSTLVACLAEWAGTDAYELNARSFGSSGYDIACALAEGPIFYSLKNGQPHIEISEFNPSFSSDLHFIHLNQKQDSREGILRYRERSFDTDALVREVSDLGRKIAASEELREFESLLETHEEVLSDILGLPTVKTKRFRDYPGTVKSLGAWGGDFILVTGEKEGLSYFRERGYTTILNYHEMVL